MSANVTTLHSLSYGRRPPHRLGGCCTGSKGNPLKSGGQTRASPDDVQWLVATKATRPRTRPVDATKSSAKCLPPRAISCNSPAGPPLFLGRPAAGLLRSGAEAYSYACRRGAGSSRSGMDSDLEAFSHDPADGSFAAMPGRTAAKTNYLKPRFLSY
jgi:hypothetical protein